MSDNPIAGPGVEGPSDPDQTADALAEAINEANTTNAPGIDGAASQPTAEGEVASDVHSSSSTSPSTPSPAEKELADLKRKYEELQQQSSVWKGLYDMLETDEGAVGALSSYFENKPTGADPQSQSNGEEPALQKQVVALQREVEALRSHAAVQAFRTTKPDFDDVRIRMGELSKEVAKPDGVDLNTYLERLYTLAKAESGKSPKPLASAEGSASGASADADHFKQLQDRVTNAKSMEDAVKLAGEMWRQGHRA